MATHQQDIEKSGYDAQRTASDDKAAAVSDSGLPFEREDKLVDTEHVKEKIKEGVKGEDEPLGANDPSAPFAVIWYTYPLVLVAILTAVVLFVVFGNG